MNNRSMLLEGIRRRVRSKVDEKYQEAFDEIIANGAAATKKSQVDEAIEGAHGVGCF